MTYQQINKNITDVLNQEAFAIQKVAKNLPQESNLLIEYILNTSGHIVFSGMGKSGFVARKLAATFSSMGKAALFLHPSEALHGDLGMLKPNDLFIALSKSGTGKEFEQILPILRTNKNKTCLLCCNKGKLNSLVDLTICLPFTKEACSLNLAPTTSSTIMMAFGDAIAVTVSKISGFKENDFAKHHPAGALGKRLFLTVNSFMCTANKLPLINIDTSVQDAILTITKKKLGVGIVVDDNKKLIGIITDGDLRRAYKFGPKLFEKTAIDIMTINPKTITQKKLAYEALQIMEQFNITNLVVANEQSVVVGLVHIHDLIKAGI
jgi:arabinose-5-phosphate isomerase